jgi:hypothetical protein
VVEFLAAGAAQRERRYELIKEEFPAECRLRSLEPPSADQADRYVRSALSQAGKLLAGRVAGRLASETPGTLLTLIGAMIAGRTRSRTCYGRSTGAVLPGAARPDLAATPATAGQR